ncbi:tetratricopeptide repeat protein [Desulforamulus ruminis]|uniref:Tetratricopeptide TPR_1 repeat-containing protein n=1 Tax=Desulforamulus ruminis (strain ATCC 23193 / DSM 2154 / NCIMB 8452 / DL) TaxID=696281 RepID=F6DQS3_DESRL|nr:tetratricopeptide repeat protein [Desulforamulus ruminis]AEG62070.1 Tetratricopeptide TPR_1 repeat-containing protein [Desulforamulus ruminis DSM 2154]
MFKSLSPRARQKRFQRIVIGILVVVLSMGLIGSSMVWSGLGSAQNDTKAPTTMEERIKLLEEQAKEKPNDTGLMLNLASYYIQVGKITQADDLYAKVIQLEPKNISARQNLALSYYSQGKIDLAEKQLTEALAIEGNNADLNFQYAKLLAEKKDYQGAITAMEKVLAVQKEGPKAEEARKSIEQWKIQAGQ